MCEVQKNLCEPNPCFHGASCQLNFNSTFGYECQCPQGFLGVRCEGKVAECPSGPCQNNGTCIENMDTPGFSCVCPEDYTGDLCESKLDGCLLTGCLNGGSCIQTETGVCFNPFPNNKFFTLPN